VATRGNMRSITTVLMGLLILVVAMGAQQPLRGRIVNRDGVPQQGCRVEIFDRNENPEKPGSPPIIELFTDENGIFYLSGGPPDPSFYPVRLSLYGRWKTDKLWLDRDTIKPQTLVVDW
jgi:hypothetical protein